MNNILDSKTFKILWQGKDEEGNTGMILRIPVRAKDKDTGKFKKDNNGKYYTDIAVSYPKKVFKMVEDKKKTFQVEAIPADYSVISNGCVAIDNVYKVSGFPQNNKVEYSHFKGTRLFVDSRNDKGKSFIAGKENRYSTMLFPVNYIYVKGEYIPEPIFLTEKK
jgi:hypothetical protein